MMGILTPNIGQIIAGTPIVDIPVALVLFIYLSILYKLNPPFILLENLAVGFICGVRIVASVGSLRTQLAPPIIAGDAIYWIPVLLGLLYFSVFGKGRWRLIFRALLIISIGRDMAYNIRDKVAWSRMKIWSYAKVGDLATLVAFIVFILGITYFLFGSWLERPSRPLRSIGVYAVYAMVPAALVSFLTMFFYDFIMMLDYTVHSVAVIVPIAVVAWAIYDKLKG